MQYDANLKHAHVYNEHYTIHFNLNDRGGGGVEKNGGKKKNETDRQNTEKN